MSNNHELRWRARKAAFDAIDETCPEVERIAEKFSRALAHEIETHIDRATSNLVESIKELTTEFRSALVDAHYELAKAQGELSDRDAEIQYLRAEVDELHSTISDLEERLKNDNTLEGC